MELIYLDTCIYLDYWQGRTDRLRPLGEFAFQLIRGAIQCEFEIVVSDWVIEELEHHIRKKELNEILKPLREAEKTVQAFKTKKDMDKARQLSSNWRDALHIVLAENAGAKYLVTRNMDDFSRIPSSIETVFPENI